MIDLIIQAVSRELNEFFRLKFGVKEDRVVISNLVTPDGSPAVKDENRIIVSLVSLQEEKTTAFNNGGISLADGNKPVCLNLLILFSASFNEKLNTDALKFISAVIAFFQNKFVFTTQNTSNLGTGQQKITFEIFSLSLQEQSNMWSTLGAKYMPSILYKARFVTIDERVMTPDDIQITSPDQNYTQ